LNSIELLEQSSKLIDESLNEDYFFPAEISNTKDKLEEEEDEEFKKKPTSESYWRRLKSFFNAPKVHFFYDSLSFIVFFGFFVY